MPPAKSRLPEVLKQFEKEILTEWVQEQQQQRPSQAGGLDDAELRSQSKDLLNLVMEALQSEHWSDPDAPSWDAVREFLTNLSRTLATRGFTPSETAMFIFSLKRPLFSRLRREIKTADLLGEETWSATILLDRLGLYTTEASQKAREEVIQRQQQEMLELSTPVVKLWEGVLALPLIGTLDSARTQIVMESLLQRIVETGAEVAIIDITGVPTVDTLVAQHLLKTVTAARLMGADCIISGIRPQIAQTIVHLGVALNNVTTKASLADAFRLAIQRSGLAVVRVKGDHAKRTGAQGSQEEEKEA